MEPDGCKITACPGARERSHPYWCAAHIAESRAECLANWPEAFNGGFNPACCRFPKSCSIEDAPSPAPVGDETEVERLANVLHSETCGEELSWAVHRKYGGYACFTMARAVLAALPDLGYVRATEPDQLASQVTQARLHDEQVDLLVVITDAIANEDPYALDTLVGTIESWMDATLAAALAEADQLAERVKELTDEWAKYGPGTEVDRVMGRQIITVEFAVDALRALLPDTQEDR